MFNKETEYALRALVYIQKKNYAGGRPGIQEISKEIGAPQFFTAKILQRMVRIGFIQSIKGIGGGFLFEPGKPDLPLKKLIVAVEGDKILAGCAFGLNKCDESNPCPLHQEYAPLRNALNDLLDTQTIQSLAGKIAETDGITIKPVI